MDQLLTLLSSVSQLLIPILAVVALYFLIRFLIVLIKLTKKLNQSIESVDRSLNIVENYLDQMKAPVNTITNISRGVDQVGAFSESFVKGLIEILISNMGVLKDAISSFFTKDGGEPHDPE
jgi:predicted PurR-regulated permease PerM